MVKGFSVLVIELESVLGLIVALDSLFVPHPFNINKLNKIRHRILIDFERIVIPFFLFAIALHLHYYLNYTPLLTIVND